MRKKHHMTPKITRREPTLEAPDAGHSDLDTNPECFFRRVRLRSTPMPAKKLRDYPLSALKNLAKKSGIENFRAWAAMVEAGYWYDLAGSIEYAEALKNISRPKSERPAPPALYKTSGDALSQPTDWVPPADWPAEFVLAEDGSLAAGYAWTASGDVVHVTSGRIIKV